MAHTRDVVVVVGDERQVEILERLYWHELPRCNGDRGRAVENVNGAIMRLSLNQGGAFSDPLNISDFQDAGLSVNDAMDVLEWSWAGLQEAKRSAAPPLSRDDEIAIHTRATRDLLDALRRAWRTLVMREPKHLRVLIRCMWRHCANVGAPLIRCDLGASIGAITGDEALAIAKNAELVAGLDANALRRLFATFASLRGQVRPDRFLRIVQAVGVDAAIAFGVHTDSLAAAARAEELRKQHALSVGGYLLTYGALKERHAIRFEDYVELTAVWPPDVVRRVFESYPSARLLTDAVAQGLGGTVVLAAQAGVPHAALERFGTGLLRYLKGRDDGALTAATDAFARYGGDAAATDALLALPRALREHPAIHRAIEVVGTTLLGDQLLLELVVAIADAGYAVDIELLREFRRAGTWPNTQSMRLVYGLAQRFKAIGVPNEAALRRAAEAHDRLSPRKCARAIRDVGYFRYVVLDELPLQVHPEGNSPKDLAGTAVDAQRNPAQSTLNERGPHQQRVRGAETGATSPMAPGEPAEPTLDLRTIHERLDLRDVAPTEIVPGDAAAVILYGFCDLGLGIPRAGRHYIVEQNARGRIRRRYPIPEHRMDSAWKWLASIGIIMGPRRRGGDWAYAMDIHDRHVDPTAREVSRRVRSLLQWFREQTRLR
ncbi:hypothetical protein HY635_02915 [Candidatus Uhrbacteria bacterium]|nr:hypothetical protein [Candidatus Uhrbacteria bacterium]